MGNSRARLLAAGALAAAVLAPFGAAPATAAQAEPSSDARFTTIVAGSGNKLGINLKPKATLTDETGAPLVGVQVKFYPKYPDFIFPLCVGVTNAQGVAKCGGLQEQFLVLTYGGFEARYDGGDVIGGIFFWPSQDFVGLFGA